MLLSVLSNHNHNSKHTTEVIQVDIIEWNTFIEPRNSDIVLDQYIFYSWDVDIRNETTKRYQVRDFRIIKNGRQHIPPEESKKIERDINKIWLEQGGNSKIKWILVPEPLCHKLPYFDYNINRWVLFLHDSKDGKMKIIHSSIFRLTYTYFDPEIEEREILPERKRRKLIKD